MKNDLFLNKAIEKSATKKFFYDLLDTKCPNWRKASDKERVVYLLKYYTGTTFFALVDLYYSFIGWVTQYYPFSLLYKDRLFHHDNLKILELMIKIEKIAKKEGINIFVLRGTNDGDMVELNGYLNKGTRNRQKVLGSLEATLQKTYGSVYVRDQGNKIRILFPAELFEIIVGDK